MINILHSMMNGGASSSSSGHRNSKRYKKRHSSAAASLHACTGVARAIASSRSATMERFDRSLDFPEDRRRIESRFSGRSLTLDDDTLDGLCDYYAKIKDKYALFEKGFVQLFAKEDRDIAAMFGLQNVPEKELKKRNVFRTHVCKFMRFWTTIIDLLPKKGREVELIQIIRMVGRQHCNVKTLTFTASRWLSFKSMLMGIFVPDEHDKTAFGWSVLIAFVIFEIKDAYLTHVRHVRSNSMPHVLEAYRFDFRRKSAAAPDEDDSIAE
uniref:GLOBIN domain-containing protein n=1 Tax=Panagrellus redivivus TaxID=6233 RepID=A0A7E4UN08_PANRE